MKAHPLFPYFLEKCLTIPTSPFFIFSSNGFCVTIKFRLFDDPLPSFVGRQYRWVGRN